MMYVMHQVHVVIFGYVVNTDWTALFAVIAETTSRLQFYL